MCLSYLSMETMHSRMSLRSGQLCPMLGCMHLQQALTVLIHSNNSSRSWKSATKALLIARQSGLTRISCLRRCNLQHYSLAGALISAGAQIRSIDRASSVTCGNGRQCCLGSNRLICTMYRTKCHRLTLYSQRKHPQREASSQGSPHIQTWCHSLHSMAPCCSMTNMRMTLSGHSRCLGLSMRSMLLDHSSLSMRSMLSRHSLLTRHHTLSSHRQCVCHSRPSTGSMLSAACRLASQQLSA